MAFKHLLLLAAAIVPGVLICWYIYRMDKYDREAPLPLALSFILGAVLTYPVLKIELWATGLPAYGNASLLNTLFSSFVVVALTEEAAKYLALMAYPYRSRFFDEPMDGIVYAVMISMGLATTENLLYALQYGIETTILRAFTAVPAHAAFAVMMGYYCGRAKFEDHPKRRRRFLLAGLLVPLGVHGLYDFFILQEAYSGLLVLAILILALSLFFAQQLLLEQQEKSPFKGNAGE